MGFCSTVLQTGRRYGRQVVQLPRRTRENAETRRRDRITGRSPDRAVLTEILFPALADAGAFARGAQVLWIGCRGYTAKYYRRIERDGAACWTIDLDPAVSRWGRKGRHIIGNMLDLGGLFPSVKFDAVLCNGVFGFGVNAIEDQIRACSAMASVTTERGWLLLGWNLGRIPDPVEGNIATRCFEPETLPGFGMRRPVAGCTHVYDVLRRRISY